MWNRKTRNNNNLIFCEGPAKKVPKPSDSNDSNKPSILKALEAVVAAGRRGFLGPAAMAAAEAMPDLDLEFCDGKVVQKNPNSVPIVEERRVAQETTSFGPIMEEKKEENKVVLETSSSVPIVKEKKVVNKECDTAVAVMPPVEGIGSEQPTKMQIWICGNNVISQSMVRAKYSHHGFHLGFPSSAAFVHWQGVPAMLWDDLLPMLHSTYHTRLFPSAVVIHVGEADMLMDNCCSLVTRMKTDLNILRRAFKDVVIMWSSLLPKYLWKPSENPQVLESEYNNVNCKMEIYCNKIGICYIPHPTITAKNNSLFLPDNTLSIAGVDIFITDLKKAITPFVLPNNKS